MKVWVPYDDLADELRAIGTTVDVYDGLDGELPSPDDVEFLVAPYMLPGSSLAVAARMPRLRVIQTLTAGYEQALPYRPEGVTLCNARGVHDASTAELALALVLASLRGIPDFVRAQASGAWVHAPREALADKTVLIVGYGAIGAAIERRLLPFETSVIRVARRARVDEQVHGVDELAGLLPQADVVIVATPLTAETTHLVDASFLGQMKSGALFVNISRGGIVVTDALVAELRAGRLQAALDVTDPEPLPADHPLWQCPGVLISPHVGGNSSAFLPRAKQLVHRQVRSFLAGEPLDNVVAGPSRPSAS